MEIELNRTITTSMSKSFNLLKGLESHQSGKSSTIRESNQSRVYVRRIMLAGTGVRKISSEACGFSPVKNIFMITQKV